MRAITASRAEHLPIGEISRLSGVNIETIRYYERIKMLPAPQTHREWPSHLWRDGAAHPRFHTPFTRAGVFAQ